MGAAVALVALLPRLEPALAGWRLSPDGAEYVLLARSLARGEGYLLPVRVRYDRPRAPGDQALHPAWDERAPLWPALLAPAVLLLGDAGPGWPDPRLQLPGALLCALAAAQAAGLAGALARREGLGPRAQTASALGAGLTVALAPALVRASLHTWAEPLGVVLALASARLLLAAGSASTGWAAAALLGLVGGLARFARPEQAVLLVALPALLWLARARGRRAAPLGALLGALALVNLAGVALTGVIAPQLFLLEVADHAQVMRPDPSLAAPSAGRIVAGVAGNLAGLIGHLLTPRYAWLTLPAALLALARAGRRDPARGTLGLALALLLAPALVWSTRDPHRFSLAPLALLAPVAAVEWERRRQWLGQQWLGRRTWPRAAWLVGLVLLLGHQAGAWIERPVAPPPPGDCWAEALATGQPAFLDPQRGR